MTERKQLGLRCALFGEAETVDADLWPEEEMGDGATFSGVEEIDGTEIVGLKLRILKLEV